MIKRVLQVYRLVVAQEVDIDPNNEDAVEKAHDELESAVSLDIANIGQEIPYDVSSLSMESCLED